MNIQINKKDDIILKILHYFITEEDYKPVIINGLDNEIWLENMEKDLKLIRINNNYIHNDEQLKNDMNKAKSIMKTIKKNTFSFNMNMLNLLLDTGENVKGFSDKNIETVKVSKINDFKKNKVVSEFFPKVKNAILNEQMDPVEFFKLTEDMNQKTIKNEKKLARIFSNKKPAITYAILVLNVMIFVFGIAYGHQNDMINMFGNNYLLVRNGEFYRLFTCMFLHSNLLHLVCNMYALWMLGPTVERYYGRLKYSFVYIASGLLGSLFSCAFMGENSISIGASGAIFGLMGSIAYFTFYYRATLQGTVRNQIIPVIVANLLIGVLVPGIDMSAHIGGLVAGFLASMAIGIGKKKKKSDEINGSIVLGLLFLFMTYITLTK